MKLCQREGGKKEGRGQNGQPGWLNREIIENEKSAEDLEKEKELLKKLLEIVNEKARLVDEQDEEQQRHSAEAEGEMIVENKMNREIYFLKDTFQPLHLLQG